MGHGKETPRQKMIGMMYLFYTALLALNVAKDVLDSFVLVDESLYTTTQNFNVKNAGTYAEFAKQAEIAPAKVAPWQKKALTVREEADALVEFIQRLKIKIVETADSPDTINLLSGKDGIDAGQPFLPIERQLWKTAQNNFVKVPSFDIVDKNIKSKDDNNVPAQIMMVSATVGGKTGGEALKERFKHFKEVLTPLVAETELKATIDTLFSTADVPKNETEPARTWEAKYFEHLPLIAVLTNMTKFQSDVRNVEAEVTSYLLSGIDAGSIKVNKVEAMVLPNSNYILQGGQYEARVILAAYDSLQKPDIKIGKVTTVKAADGTIQYKVAEGGQNVSYDANGKAIYRATANSVGNFEWGGLLEMHNPDGTVVQRPFSAKYQVGKADAVISATKMNVFYIGVDNPVSISVSGVPSDKITASMTNGSLVRSGGNWVARPSKAGAKAVVTVSANIDGKSKMMGRQEYRVKEVPNPVAKVAGKIGGKIDKATLSAQLAVIADMENFDFDLKFNVVDFSVSAVVKGFTQTKISKSARITPEQKALISGLAKGSKVYFEDIKVVGPDKRTRELPAIAFTII